MSTGFDQFLRYDELRSWLDQLAADHPNLLSIEPYGTSSEGRDLLLATITDTSTGAHHTKPAHWVDASIHAVELTATVAACYLANYLVSRHGSDELVTRALQTRTFYIVPRVNPDGAEWALADSPRHRRSSTRAWPWTDGHRWPGLHREDIDGNGRLLQMRIRHADGGWMKHPEDQRLMVPIPAEGAAAGTETYRLLSEGTIEDYDGFTVPTPPAVEGLDLNRNFPSGWDHSVAGAGDHPLSEPEIEALVRAITARPNICGYNAYHTSGGVLLRPSSTQADSALAPQDLWVWNELANRGTELTGYPAHSVYEDFTWDKNNTMSGAADDWAYDHLGVYGWTTEFWDIVFAATGEKQPTTFWTTGPTPEQALAVLRWCDKHHRSGYVDWQPFEHRQLGPIEIGGWDDLTTWANPPPHLLEAEVAPHAPFAVYQALCAPAVDLVECRVSRLGDDLWRVEAAISNTGWLPTDVTALARKQSLVKPVTAEIKCPEQAVAVEVLDGPARRSLGQLEGRAALRFRHGDDGTPDRDLVSWTVRAAAATTLHVSIHHDRAGTATESVTLQ